MDVCTFDRRIAKLQRGPLELVTAASLAIWTAAEAKPHCRVDHDDEDTLFDGWIAAATDFVQGLSSRQFLTATYDLPLSGWWGGLLKIDTAPLQSVTSLKYYDTDEVLTTVSALHYIAKTPAKQKGYIELHSEDFDWPNLHGRAFPVYLRFVAGWTTPASIPASFRQAVMMIVAWWSRNREAGLTGTISKEVEFSVTAILDAKDLGSYS